MVCHEQGPWRGARNLRGGCTVGKGSESELMPCPFCGSTDLLQTDKMENELSDEATETLSLTGEEDVPPEEWFVVCGRCGAMGPMSPSGHEAQTAWNRRLAAS